jgi:competence protein ComEA
MDNGWKDYFTFTKKERKAVFILLTLIIIVAFLPKLFPANKMKIVEFDLNDSSIERSYVSEEKEYPNRNDAEEETLSPVTFDPNTVDEVTMQRMNFRPKLISTIINFRNKGGKFFKPEDLRKLYTLKKEEADVLLPYVRMNSIQTENKFSPNNFSSEKIKLIDHVIDINTATIDEVKRLPGVSFSLANKIIRYREVIGGFKNADQLKKTYGMNDSIFTAIKPWIIPLAEKSLININTASLKEMLTRNTVPEHVAKAIIIYREQHKGFKSVSELMNIPFISKELFDKISPSLTIE